MKSIKGWSTVSAIMTLVFLLAASNAIAGKTTFVSTDFNMKQLNRSLWTFSSPSNDGQIAMVDFGTSDAAVRITTPAGSEHDIWKSGDNTVRIMQPATDTPFSLEVKFLNGLVGGTSDSYQAQGVMVEQDANTKIIFAFTTTSGTPTSGDSIGAYTAAFIGGYGSPSVKVFKNFAALGEGPLWMRVLRQGNVWKQLCSLDGAAWDTTVSFTQALAVAKVGPFADNAGAKAAKFSSYVDYFFNLDSIAYADDSHAVPADTQAPWIHSVRLLGISSNAAQIAWSTDEISDGKIDYGKTTTYDLNVLDLNQDYYHSVLLSDLSASTLYNFRISAGDNLGHVSSTSNDTFNSTGNVTDVTSRSDGFSGAALNSGIWATVNPRGDAVISTSSDQLSISVPSGVTHDLWSDGDNVPRVTQSLSAATVREYVVKYNTGVSGNANAYQFEGLVFRESDTKMMRVDFVSDPGGTRIFCATFAGLENPTVRMSVNIGVQGMFPLYMRVRQNGAYWTVHSSTDGSAWTLAGDFWAFFSPIEVGISAGNSGAAPPAFTALVDFFQGAMPASPRLDSPLNDATGLTLPVTVNWGLGISATSYQVQVARDSLFTTMVVNDSSLANPTKILSTLQNDQKYYWRVRSKNAAGSSAYSDVWHFTTAQGVPGAPALLAPLNNATNVAVDQNLRWSSTKNAISYYLRFGKDSTFATTLVNDSTLTDTVYAVTGLDMNTKYFWRLRVTTPGGTSAPSLLWRFTTVVPPPDAVALKLPVQNDLIARDSVKFVWFKAQPSVTKYWHEFAPDINFQFTQIDSNVTDTVKTVKPIPNHSNYYWRVKAKNLSGWGSFSEVRLIRVEYTGVTVEQGIPKEYTLAQNFPNPFNPSTRIEFGVPHSGHVILEVFNTLGDRVATVLDETMEAGYHQVSFDGSRFATGIYFYRLVTDHTVLMKKMALVK